MVLGVDCDTDDQRIYSGKTELSGELLRGGVHVVDDPLRNLLGGGAN